MAAWLAIKLTKYNCEEKLVFIFISVEKSDQVEYEDPQGPRQGGGGGGEGEDCLVEGEAGTGEVWSHGGGQDSGPLGGAGVTGRTGGRQQLQVVRSVEAETGELLLDH